MHNGTARQNGPALQTEFTSLLPFMHGIAIHSAAFWAPARTRGNVMLLLLLAIILIAGLTAAITRTERGGENMDAEKNNIAASEVGSFAADLRRATDVISHNGHSESTISFAKTELTGYGTPETSPETEIFNVAGGGAAYIDVPKNINNGAQWEFFGYSAAPGVGEEAEPDLMLVLPNVTEKFCRAYNKRAGYDESASIPTDDAACLYDTSKRFAGSFATGGDINTMNGATFRTPAAFACVACSGPVYHAYYVLIER